MSAALVLAGTATAQTSPNVGPPTSTDTSLATPKPAASPLDSEEPAFDAVDTTPPAKTGDPILDRFNALDARIKALEARNRSLEDELRGSQKRIEIVEVRAAKSVQPAISPTLADTGGMFSFKARGVVDADFVHFNERAGGYDFNSGTAFRRARLGVEGTAFRDFAWRLEVDFAGNAVAIQDAYLQYNGFKPLAITLGQFKAPFGLESNNSDNYNSFIERGMFTNAFGNAGAERRLGLSVAYIKDSFTLTGGFFGDNESISRSTVNPVTATRSESYGVNGRVTWEPVFDTGRILHVGAASYYRTSLRSGDTIDAVRVNDRPNVRVDGGNIVDSGVVPNVDNLVYLGVEGTGVLGPLSITGEYGRLRFNRFGGLRDFTADGFYVYGSWFVTGETRPFKAGNFDRIRPKNDFSNKGGTGAVELVLRYDSVDVGDTPVAARALNDADSYTAGVNWYLTPNLKLQFNYVRFAGTNTPLDPVGNRTRGDAVATRLHIDW